MKNLISNYRLFILMLVVLLTFCGCNIVNKASTKIGDIAEYTEIGFVEEYSEKATSEEQSVNINNSNSYYEQYLYLLEEYLDTYGEVSKTIGDYEYGEGKVAVYSGVVVADLLDFNNDGIDELFFVINTSTDRPEYVVEVWAYINNDIKMVSNEYGISYLISADTSYVSFFKDSSSRIYLFQGDGSEFNMYPCNRYFSLENDTFDAFYTLDRRMGEEPGERLYYVNEKPVSEEDFFEVNDKLEYSFGYSLFPQSAEVKLKGSVIETEKELKDYLGIDSSDMLEKTENINEDSYVLGEWILDEDTMLHNLKDIDDLSTIFGDGYEDNYMSFKKDGSFSWKIGTMAGEGVYVDDGQDVVVCYFDLEGEYNEENIIYLGGCYESSLGMDVVVGEEEYDTIWDRSVE